MTVLVAPARFVIDARRQAVALALADVMDDERRFHEARARMAGRCAVLARLADAIVERDLAREADPTGAELIRWSSYAVWALNRKIAAAMAAHREAQEARP